MGVIGGKRARASDKTFEVEHSLPQSKYSERLWPEHEHLERSLLEPEGVETSSQVKPRLDNVGHSLDNGLVHSQGVDEAMASGNILIITIKITIAEKLCSRYLAAFSKARPGSVSLRLGSCGSGL